MASTARRLKKVEEVSTPIPLRELPIDPARMRFANDKQLDPAWLMHHFTWTRGSDGFDILEERPGFTPFPYRGEFTNENDYASYQLEPAGAALRTALW